MSEQKYATWNPWHGCTKYSEGCRVPRRFQTLQARKAGIDYKIIDGYLPDI